MARSSMALQRGSAHLHSLAQLSPQFHSGTSTGANQANLRQAVANPTISRVQNRCPQNEAVSADGGALPIVGWLRSWTQLWVGQPYRFSEQYCRAAPCRTYVIIFAFCWLLSPRESLYMTCTLEHCLGRLPWDGRCLLLLGQHRSWLTFPPGDAKFQIDIFVEISRFFFNFWVLFWNHFLGPFPDPGVLIWGRFWVPELVPRNSMV